MDENLSKKIICQFLFINLYYPLNPLLLKDP